MTSAQDMLCVFKYLPLCYCMHLCPCTPAFRSLSMTSAPPLPPSLLAPLPPHSPPLPPSAYQTFMLEEMGVQLLMEPDVNDLSCKVRKGTRTDREGGGRREEGGGGGEREGGETGG